MRSYDEDGLTPVNPKHFDFGFKVIKWVSEAVTTAKLGSNLDVTKIEREMLLENKQLQQEFLELTESHKALDKEGKLKILRQLLQKVANVKFHDVVTVVGRRKTGRGTKEAPRAEETTRGRVDLIALKKKTKK